MPSKPPCARLCRPHRNGPQGHSRFPHRLRRLPLQRPRPFCALREVWARVSMGYLLEISSTGGLIIATSPPPPVKGKVIIDETHYTRHKIERGNWNAYLSRS